MRDHVLLFVNGRPHSVAGDDAFLSLSDYLRLRLRLVGTKIVCSEGDCGSCTVLVGRADARAERFKYRPIDSCIQWMFQLDGTHVVTVEGLAGGSPACQEKARPGPDCHAPLTPVQEALVSCHGSQCGFCTPGFVVAMTGLLDEHGRLDEDRLRYGLTGNLCRCTGYVPIVDAGVMIDVGAVQLLNGLYPPQPILRELSASAADSIIVETRTGSRTRRFFSPTSLAEALNILGGDPHAKVVAGATDVGVQLNKGVIDPDVILDLNRVAELQGVELAVNGDGNVLTAGARATWAEIEAVCHKAVPEFYRIVSIFGSPQIRHVGTIGGNIINASPIADSLPFLLVAEAQLELVSAGGTRSVPISDFYQGYKLYDLRPGELLSRVRVPLPAPGELLRLMKVSRRRDLDIATFTAAIWMQLEGERIADARVAFGAVGPTVTRARRTEAFLRGRVFAEDTMGAAGDVAVGEISPISDVRGSAEYRYQLTRNALRKFYHEQALAAV